MQQTIIWPLLLLLSVRCGTAVPSELPGSKGADRQGTDTAALEPIDLGRAGTAAQHPSALEVKRYVDSLANYRYKPDVTEDPGDLASDLAERLVSAINAGIPYDLDLLLNKDAGTAYAQVTCYSFGYDCGGTQGFINCPIITWKDANDRLRAFNLSAYRHCRFVEVHELTPELFLLIGNAQGSGACHQYTAYVIAIDPTGLDASYRAFDGRPYLNYCNTPFKYDASDRVLYTSRGPDEGREDLHGQTKDRSLYQQFSSDGMEQGAWFADMAMEYHEQGTIRLIFNNDKFRPVGLQ